MTTVWILYDKRTGKRVASASYMTEQQGLDDIGYFRARDARGKRQDIHDLIPHLGVVESTPETFGSRPGDVVTTPGT